MTAADSRVPGLAAAPSAACGPVLTGSGVPLAFHVLAKPAGAVCGPDGDAQDKRDTLAQYCRDWGIPHACHDGCPRDRVAISAYGDRCHGGEPAR